MNQDFNEFDPTGGASSHQAPGIQESQPEKVNPAPAAPVAPSAPVSPKPVSFANNDEIREYKIPGVVERNLAGVALSDEALKIKARLAKEPRIQTYIPLDPGERPGAYRSVTINGYRCEVKKGKMVSLPQSIANLLLRSMQIEMDTLNENEHNLANASEETRKALGA